MILPHPAIAPAGPHLGRAMTVLLPRAASLRTGGDADAGGDPRVAEAPLALSHGLHPRALGISATSALAPPSTRQGRAPLTIGI